VAPEAAGTTGIELGEAFRRYGTSIGQKGILDDSGTFLAAVAAAPRFSHLGLRNYVDIDGVEYGTQFCAMEFVLGSKLSYVAFRGTDNTIVGWREDFEISYREVPAQRRALAYLERVLLGGRRYYVGGHSKGANLAMYGTVFLHREQQDLVSHVYVNDGPGLCPSVVSVALPVGYAEKTTRILPEYSVFGRLFEIPGISEKIVSSSYEGIMEHELLSWEVSDGGLSLVQKHDAASEWVAATLDEWLENVSAKERETFVRELFSALGAGGSRRTSEFGARGIDGLEDVLHAMVSAKPGAKRALVKLPVVVLLGNVLRQAKDMGPLMWAVTDPIAHMVELVLVGMLFLLAPDNALLAITSFVLLVVTAGLLAETVIRLYRKDWQVGDEGWRITVSVCAAVLYFVTLVKNDALYIYGSTLLGIALTGGAVGYARRALKNRGNGPVFWFEIALAVMIGACASFILVAPYETLAGFSITLGLVLVACGATELVLLWQRGEGPLTFS